jgi:hypothetical protein
MEIVTIVISVIALLFSVASFYFQFFYKKDTIACTLIGYNANTKEVVVQLAIGNAGTRPIMLKDARLKLEFKAKEGSTMYYDDINQRNIAEPLLIPKDEIKSIVLTSVISDSTRQCIDQWHSSGHLVGSDGSWPFRAHLIFVSVSGKILTSEKVVLTIEWMKDGIRFMPCENSTWQIRSDTFNPAIAHLAKVKLV